MNVESAVKRISPVVLTICLLVMLLIAGWVAYATIHGKAMNAEQQYICLYCRMKIVKRTMFGVVKKPQYEASEFTKYYMHEIRPHHKHHWIRGNSYNHRFFQACTYRDAWLDDCIPFCLREDTALAILRALPDHKTRCIFLRCTYPKLVLVRKNWCMYVDKRELSRMKIIYQASCELNDAYTYNPKRKDWIELIRRYKLYPQGH